MSVYEEARQADRPDPGVITALGQVPTPSASWLLDAIAERYRAYDMTVISERAGAVRVVCGVGTVSFRRSASGLDLRVQAGNAANLHTMREGAVAQIDALDPRSAEVLSWSDTPEVDEHPANFRLGRIDRIAPLGRMFWRIHLSAADLGPFARDGLHLRLALPPAGETPVWPWVDRAGRTRWAEGPGALHVAVFTIRAVDAEAGTMVIDAFRHGRGRTCAWLSEARPGDTVGLMGPSGGWLPEAPHLVLAGDETAQPAIARILESVPPGTTGTALVEVDRHDPALEIATPPGVALSWVERARGGTLETALADVELGPPGTRHVWFAAEKTRATAMRRHLREDRGVGRAESYAAAYWAR